MATIGDIDKFVVEKIVSFIPNPSDLMGARHVFDHVSPRLAQYINTRALVTMAVHVNKAQLIADKFVNSFTDLFFLTDIEGLKACIRLLLKKNGFLPLMTRMSVADFTTDFLNECDVDLHARIPQLIRREMKKAGYSIN